MPVATSSFPLSRRSRVSTGCLCAGIFAALSSAAFSNGTENTTGDSLADLSFEQLLSIQILSASKRLEPLSNVPAAVTVLKGDELLGTGAVSIAETLRWVPGLDVAQINASDWAISARGFNGLNANKLLVMVDGRSVYTPLFAGVYWDSLNPILQDLKRIEVVKGPGGSLWGANAVNGVINILSKPARETQGGLLYVGAGNERRTDAGLRHGSALGDRTWLRVYANHTSTAASESAAGLGNHDAWDILQTGFRLDSELGELSSITLQGDYSSGTIDRESLIPSYTGILRSLQATEIAGANLLGRWTYEPTPEAKLTVQGYWDHSRRVSAIAWEERNTFDLDLQYDWTLGSRHTLTCGAGLRQSLDSTRSDMLIRFHPEDYTFRLLNAFVQDEISLVPSRVSLTLGAKVEHNSFTSAHFQPSARLLWTPTTRQSYWLSVSRAVRIPTRADTGLEMLAGYYPPQSGPLNPTSFPMVTTALGNADIESESVVSWEAGWRAQQGKTLSLDLALFANEYRNLIYAVPGQTVLETTPAPAHLLTPTRLYNSAKATSYGGELAVNWKAADRLRIAPFYSYKQVTAHKTMPSPRDLSGLDADSPAHQLGVRGFLTLSNDLELNLNLRWIDRVPAHSIGSYAEADLHLVWHLRKDLDLTFTGRNLLHARHVEYASQFIEPTGAFGRSVFTRLLWHF